MREDSLFQEFLVEIGKESLPPEEEIYMRKMIRKDVKTMIRKERERDGIYSEGEYYDPNGEYRMDDKIIYGSSSENDIDQEVNERFMKNAIEDDEDEDDNNEMEFSNEEAKVDQNKKLDLHKVNFEEAGFDQKPQVNHEVIQPRKAKKPKVSKSKLDTNDSTPKGSKGPDNQSANESNSDSQSSEIEMQKIKKKKKKYY